LTFDGANQEIYVADFVAHNVSVIDGTTHAVVATVPVGSDPDALAVDGTDVFVANYASQNTSVIDGTTNKVVATIPGGSEPSALAVDGPDQDVFVANYGSSNVSEINGTTYQLAATVPVGSEPVALAFDGANGDVYVANFESNNVSVIISTHYSLKFIETGLPSGHDWNVTLLGVGKVSTTTNTIRFTIPNGTYSYQISIAHPQDGYKTTFNGTVTVNGAARTVRIVFTQAQYQVTFEETGLSHGTHWTVVAGTGHKTVSGSGKNLTMNLPNGTFSWTASASGYDSPTGTVVVNGATATVMVTFASEPGLPS
jgi:YVTN family beta-propeller protein